MRRLRDERLPDETQEAAVSALADRVLRRELALFLGAGMSASAELPLWGELLERLLAHAGVEAEEAAAIAKLDARDAATFAVRKLTALPKALWAILTQHREGLAHALLAALPVAQTVTTNYDQLFETARRDQGRPVAVLPFEDPQQEWLLKVHGDLGHDHGNGLTREDYLRFGERSGALAGVVQGMLMTKHVLFDDCLTGSPCSSNAVPRSRSGRPPGRAAWPFSSQRPQQPVDDSVRGAVVDPVEMFLEDAEQNRGPYRDTAARSRW